MNIILLGYPGSGKGTLAKDLSKTLDMVHVSTGDILRDEMAKKTPLGTEATSYMAGGRLVPDRLVMDMLKARLGTESRGMLFDGFPRTVAQAEALDAWFASRGQEIDAVVFLNVAESVVMARLGSRRTCTGCGKIYNVVSNPPAKEGVCDVCGKPLMTREDDKAEVITRRIQVYKDQTEPLLAYYRASANFVEADGGKTPEEVTKDVLGLLRVKP
jgi:adenylate kinase